MSLPDSILKQEMVMKEKVTVLRKQQEERIARENEWKMWVFLSIALCLYLLLIYLRSRKYRR